LKFYSDSEAKQGLHNYAFLK